MANDTTVPADVVAFLFSDDPKGKG